MTLDDGSLGKKIDPSILDSKKIIQSILNKETITLFSNDKIIRYLNCAAGVKLWHKIESVAQSLVSRYERHFDSSQQSIEQHSFDEMIIAEITDEKLERATKQYRMVANSNNKWHVLYRAEDIRSYTRNYSKLLESCFGLKV